MPYPVTVALEPQVAGRDRLTVFFRLILAIPHGILVGSGDNAPGLVGLPAYVMALFSWCTILATGRHVQGMRDFGAFYLRWRVRALAYIFLLTDRYPPFGDADYPATLSVTDPTGERDKLSVALRVFMVIPHIVVLFFLAIGWLVVTIIAWFAILFTGEYPASMAPFSLNVLRYVTRIEAYLLLLVDDYPPLPLSEDDARAEAPALQ